MGEIIDSPQEFPKWECQNSQAPRRWGQVTEERRSGRKVSDSSRQKKICGRRIRIFLNKRVADFGERFQTGIGPDRASHGTSRSERQPRVSEPIRRITLTNPPWWAAALGTLLRDFDTGMGAMRRPVAKPISSRGPRKGTCIYPAGGVPISSRAPAHGRLASGDGPKPQRCWRDEAVSPDATLDQVRS